MIEITNATKYYCKKEGFLDAEEAYVPAFHIEALTIPDGEVVGLFGENGAGKSSLLRAIMGLTALNPADAIRIDGALPRDRRGELALIAREGSFPGFLSPAQYGQFLADVVPRFDSGRYQKLIRFFDLPHEQRADTLSDGQQAKLEIAAGFSRGAKYLLLDEPFAGKDLFTRRDFLKLLAGMLRGYETVLIATHELGGIDNFIDRAIILHAGAMAADAYLDDLRAQGETLETLLLKTAGEHRRRQKWKPQV